MNNMQIALAALIYVLSVALSSVVSWKAAANYFASQIVEAIADGRLIIGKPNEYEGWGA